MSDRRRAIEARPGLCRCAHYRMNHHQGRGVCFVKACRCRRYRKPERPCCLAGAAGQGHSIDCSLKRLTNLFGGDT